MKLNKSTYILVAFLLLMSLSLQAQKAKKIQIEYSGFLVKNENTVPGAQTFIRSDLGQVHIIHEGANLFCDQAVFYGDENFIEAYGNVKMQQGDSINMTSKYIEYSGKTKLAFASGDVVLTDPTSILTTDTLHFNRARQQAYYRSGGKVVRDSSGTITSKIGRYYMQQKKYQFVDSVKLVDKNSVVESNRLDFYSTNGHAFLYGPSTITTEESKVYCEKCFYDTENKEGYAVKNSRINYDNRVFEADSMFFNQNKNFASGTNNIKVTDTTNKAVFTGHYAEVYKEKDSVFITKRALAMTYQENDSTYLHSDIIMVTGKPDNRVTRAYYNAKIYKSDMSGKADSIHTDQKTGLTRLINLARFSSKDAFASKRNPVIWNLENQMTGDTINLQSNTKTEKLDSLIVFNNAFLISKDSLGAGYNQISGKKLIGLFNDNNEIYKVNINKNAESIFYARNDDNELIGIDKAKSGSIEMYFEDKDLVEYRRLKEIDANTYPEGDFPKNAKKLKGFVWRDDERPKSVEDLFKDDLPLELPVIKGLEDYIPQEEFFDDELIGRIEKADKEAKTKPTKKKPAKASRTLPKNIKKQKLNKSFKKESKFKKKEISKKVEK